MSIVWPRGIATPAIAPSVQGNAVNLDGRVVAEDLLHSVLDEIGSRGVRLVVSM
jgi:hypothetical protein